MPLFKNLFRGYTTRPDFLADGEHWKAAVNTRSVIGRGTINRNGTDLLRNLTELDSTKTYVWTALDDNLIAIGENPSSSPNLKVFAFKTDGTEVSIKFGGTLPYTSGTAEIKAGDTITGGTSGATATVLGITRASGTWGGGTAAGDIYFRQVNGTNFTNGETVTSSPSTGSVTGGAQTLIGYSYLGTDISKIRTLVRGNSILVCNTGTTITTSASPSATVTKEFTDYYEMQKDTTIAIDLTYRTIQSNPGYPAGHYKCYRAYAAGPPVLYALFTRVPKPSQNDAIYNSSTMPFRLVRTADDTYVWEDIDWTARFSGGDVEGQDVNGLPIIRNPAYLKNAKILAMSEYQGRLALGTDQKDVLLSASLDYFNFFANDVLQVVASDPIRESVGASNSGDIQWFAPTSDSLFIQCEHRQAQFFSGSEALSAGSASTVYNGRLKYISDFESGTIEPIPTNNSIFFLDKSNDLYVYGISVLDEGFRVIGKASTLIEDDLRQLTISRMAFVNTTLYLVESGGSIYSGQVIGVERSGLPTLAWQKMTMDEDLFFVWGYGNRVYIVTNYGADFSILKHYDHDPVLPTGFRYDPRLDRRETLVGTYSAVTNLTTFTVNTTGMDVDTCRFVALTDDGPYNAGQIVVPYDVTGTTVKITGDVSDAGGHYLGRLFTGTVTLPTQWNGMDRRRVIVRTTTVFHDNTSNYIVTFSRPNRSDNIYYYTSKTMGVYVGGAPSVDDNKFTMRSGGIGWNLTVSIEQNTGGQMLLCGVAIEGEVAA